MFKKYMTLFFNTAYKHIISVKCGCRILYATVHTNVSAFNHKKFKANSSSHFFNVTIYWLTAVTKLD